MQVEISKHFQSRHPSPIRLAQILFAQRADRDQVEVVNIAIGNVSRPMHPAMQARMRGLGAPESPFSSGVVKYTATVGTAEAQAAFLNIIASGGWSTDGLHCVVTDGGSQAMALMVLGVCGPGAERPLMLLDPAYTNYLDMARRANARTVSLRRELAEDGSFAPPDLAALEAAIRTHRPCGLVVIPADNPTGQLVPQSELVEMARLCVRHNIWMISDEAYRQLHYTHAPVSSIWAITEQEVPGITGRRISIESASKVWNACGLRIGGLVTDNAELHTRAVAELTANLCANALGQHLFGALAHLDAAELQRWYAEQRGYYAPMLRALAEGFEAVLPGIIVSLPQASLYSVVDLRRIAPPGFDAGRFVSWCASEGRVSLDGTDYTLLVAPMQGFYTDRSGGSHGATQLRLAMVESPEKMALVPRLFAALFRAYSAQVE
ncbi:MAG: aminotransferase class I/II [Deltaproteobacteria bacterium]|nr:aminotransferase class I/II [Deltaproteobacteria bacterium]HCH65586.1 aminotransferase class I/II [Deltaproteobacteria bacterium]